MSLLQQVKSGMGSADWNVSTVDIHLRKLLWVYCPGHAGVKGNSRADRLAGKASLTNGLFLGRSEVLRSLRRYLPQQSQGHHTIDRLEERGVEEEALDDLPERTREGHRQSDEHWNHFKGDIGETTDRRGGAHNYRLFRAHKYHLELN